MPSTKRLDTYPSAVIGSNLTEDRNKSNINFILIKDLIYKFKIIVTLPKPTLLYNNKQKTLVFLKVNPLMISFDRRSH